MTTTILNDIFLRHHWLSVEAVLLQCYPDQQKSIDGYRNVFENLQKLVPVDTTTQIRITFVKDEQDNGDDYHDVSGFKPGESVSYAIEFRPWAEWLGMEVTQGTLSAYTELEIAAHCLFEMTFMGYEEQEIQAEWDKIESISEELDNMTEAERKKRTTSLEDFLRGLDEGESLQ